MAAAGLMEQYGRRGWFGGRPADRLADALVREHGVAFAAAAAVHAAGVDVSQGRLVRENPLETSCRVVVAPLYERVRAHLAAASDAEYAQAVAAVAEVREGTLVQRVVAAYLLPDQVAWADEVSVDWAATAGPRTFPPEPGRIAAERLLLCALSSVESLARIADVIQLEAVEDLDVVMTLVEGVGPAAVPVLMRWFDEGEVVVRRNMLAVATHVPTDEAMQALIDRVDQRFVAPALSEMVKRYPRRALRLLGAAAEGTAARARAAADMLQRHARAYPDLVAEVAPTLPPEVRARVESATDDSDRVPEADPATLPEVLVTPPWTQEATAPTPVVVPGLEPTIERFMAWAPGERQRWAVIPGYQLEDSVLEKRMKQPVLELEEPQRATMLVQAPESYARPLLDAWRPGRAYHLEGALPCIVARYEGDAAAFAMHAARVDPVKLGSALLPYAYGDVAPLMAEWLVKRKSVRDLALTWLTRHPRVAALALIPAALDTPGPARQAAEAALLAIAAAGHEPVIREAAATYGEAAVAGIEALLHGRLARVPDPIPSLPDWAAPELHPQVLLRDRATALPAPAVTHLATMLAISKLGEVYAGIDVVKEIVDRESLVEWAWSLLQAWEAAGAPASEGWVLDAQGIVGTDETIRRLTPVIHAWPGVGGHQRAVKALDVLVAIGTDLALRSLYDIAQTAAFKGLKARANDKVAELAERLGLTADQLADRLVPDFGLEPDGRVTLDYGPRRFIVGFDEQLLPYVTDETGKRRKSLPKPTSTDDPTVAEAAYQRFAALKKNVPTVARQQIHRLEAAMVMQRRWTVAEFQEFFVTHPLLWHVVRRLVWGVYDADGTFRYGVRLAEDRTFADVHDEAIEIDPQAMVGIAHPLHLADTLAAWASLFADYEIVQPFPQLTRPTYALPAEEHDATRLSRFEKLTVPTIKLLELTNHGWERGERQVNQHMWMLRLLPDYRALVVNLDPGIPVGLVTGADRSAGQTLEAVWVNDVPGGAPQPNHRVRFGELDPVTASEILRDLTDLTS